MKAFLSHSWSDKELVRAVAVELGRHSVIFDEYSFRSGLEFRSSIESGFDESSMFVLFASEDALSSVWVGHEVDEAWYRALESSSFRQLVFIIDSSVTLDQLPRWLKRPLVQTDNAPQSIAREIQGHLDELRLEHRHEVFIGRSNEIAELENALIPVDGSRFRNVVFVTGLEGIGRRTLLRRAIPSLLSLRRIIEFHIKDGDSINDICAVVAGKVEPYSTHVMMNEMIREIEKLTENQAQERLVANIRRLITLGELPVFIDDGGLVNNEGFIVPAVRLLLRPLTESPGLYAAFVLTRRPRESEELSLPHISVRELSPPHTRQLVSALSQQHALDLSSEEVSALATHAAGYPPAARFAIQTVRDYGLPIALEDSERFARFRYRAFVHRLKNLDSDEQKILRLIASYGPLPLRSVAATIGLDDRRTIRLLTKLIDSSLIAPTDSKFYQIAQPLARPVEIEFGVPSDAEHRVLVDSLLALVKLEGNNVERFELSRVLFRAARSVGYDEATEDISYLVSDLIQVARALYFKRQYDRVIVIAQEALQERPRSELARTMLVRALIQEEQFSRAEAEIEQLSGYSAEKDILFLRGFMERKRGRTGLAIDCLEGAIRKGRGDEAVNRELAQCYALQGDLDKAWSYTQVALKRHPDKPYLLDLSAEIALKRRDEPAARDAARRYEAVGDKSYYHHRMSTIERMFSGVGPALREAEAAVEADPDPRIEVLLQLASLYIETHRIADAEPVVSRIEKRYSRTHMDRRLGMRVRLEVAKGRCRAAITLTEQFIDKNNFGYKRCRADALHCELISSALKDATRMEYKTELGRLEDEIKSAPDNIYNSVGIAPIG